jgi:hypothetical protein
MAHIRTQLRNAIKTRLTGLATTGSSVFNNRQEILSDAELPALIVRNDLDQITSRAIGSQAAPHARMEQRTVSIKVQAYAKQNTGLDDVLDQMCLEVEKAIAADIFMGGLTNDARLMSTSVQFDESSEKVEGSAEMIWEFDTWVPNNAPDTQA